MFYGPPVDELSERILDVAMELAERDGYEAVRIRELAEKAGVALGTVYRRFASKEDILAGALERESSRLEERLRDHLLPGARAEDRLDIFFTMATTGLVVRPKLARAMLRTIASGDPELSQKITRFHGRMTLVIVGVMRGQLGIIDAAGTPDETIAHFLQHIWFGGLVGWAGGLHPPEAIHAQMKTAARVLLRGQEALVYP